VPNLNCTTQANSSEDPITIGWIVIPKGVSTRSKGSGTVQVLALTTMALFKQQTFFRPWTVRCRRRRPELARMGQEKSTGI